MNCCSNAYPYQQIANKACRMQTHTACCKATIHTNQFYTTDHKSRLGIRWVNTGLVQGWKIQLVGWHEARDEVANLVNKKICKGITHKKPHHTPNTISHTIQYPNLSAYKLTYLTIAQPLSGKLHHLLLRL